MVWRPSRAGRTRYRRALAAGPGEFYENVDVYASRIPCNTAARPDRIPAADRGIAVVVPGGGGGEPTSSAQVATAVVACRPRRVPVRRGQTHGLHSDSLRVHALRPGRCSCKDQAKTGGVSLL